MKTIMIDYTIIIHQLKEYLDKKLSEEYQEEDYGFYQSQVSLMKEKEFWERQNTYNDIKGELIFLMDKQLKTLPKMNYKKTNLRKVVVANNKTPEKPTLGFFHGYTDFPITTDNGMEYIAKVAMIEVLETGHITLHNTVSIKFVNDFPKRGNKK